MVAYVQGIYFLATGIWSLVHIASFQKVTGPKTDLWLVKTVGLLVIAIGAGLIVTAIDQDLDRRIVINHWHICPRTGQGASGGLEL